MIRGIVFDLDDTLYLERDYVASGFTHVARLIGRDEAEVRAVRQWLVRAFEDGIRGNTFDRLIAAHPAYRERATVGQLVDAYRGHVPSIRLSGEVTESLASLQASGLRLGLISDGPRQSQAAKVAALGLAEWLDPVILTDELGPKFHKPERGAFELVARAWAMSSADLAYVADNPEKDFLAPRALGWTTLRLRVRGQLREGIEPASVAHRSDAEIGSLTDLVAWVGGAAVRARHE